MKGKVLLTSNDGSHAWKMNKPTSDHDLKIVYIMPMDDLLSGKQSRNKEKKMQDKTGKVVLDITYIEISEFVGQLKKTNANAYIQLFSPLVKFPESMKPFIDELREIAMKNMAKPIQHSLAGIIHNTVVRGHQNKPKRRKLCLRQLRTIWSVMETGKWRFDPVTIKVTGAYLKRMIAEFKADMERSSIPAMPPFPELYDAFIIKLRRFVDQGDALRLAIKNVVITNKATGQRFEPGKKPDDLYDLASEIYDAGQCIAYMDMETIALGADGTWYLFDECNNIASIDDKKYSIVA